MFPGHPLPDHTADKACVATSSASMFEQGFAAAISKASHLSAEWAEKAANELNETPEAVQENIKSLRTMVLEKCDAGNVTVEDIFRTNILALEHIVQEPETQIAGLTVIMDMNGFCFQHAKFLSPYYARRTVEVIQETFPLRFKGFHVINQPFYFDAVFAVLKPFLKDKIRRRIYLHGRNLRSLHAFISPEILPAEYGGKKSGFDNKAWRLSLLANEDQFVELETYGYKVEGKKE